MEHLLSLVAVHMEKMLPILRDKNVVVTWIVYMKRIGKRAAYKWVVGDA